MKKLLMATALAGALATPAMAANTALTLWNDANPGGSETATGTNTAVLAGSSLGGITITTSGALRQSAPNSLTESNLFITNTTGTVQTLDIIAGANGFLGPNNLFKASATILSGTGQAQLTGSFFVDSTNAALGNGTNTGPVIGTNIGSFDSGLLTGPFSFLDNASTPFSVLGPYGMAESLQLVLQPGAFVGVQAISLEGTSAVPEPGTWAMGIAGFGLLAALGLRKRRVPRFAV